MSYLYKTKKQFAQPVPADIDAINAEQLAGGIYFMQLTLRDAEGHLYTLPNEPLVSLSRSKTIVKTATIGKDRVGTVKEYITTEDWSIALMGECTSEDKKSYPTTDVKTVLKVANYVGTFEIVDNKFFELFGIRKVVVEQESYDSMLGKQGTQYYSLRLISDNDFYAEMDDKNVERKYFIS